MDNQKLEIVLHMAALFESDSKEEEFLGFGQENEPNRNISDSKSYLFQLLTPKTSQNLM